ncbi:hypothetical protein LTS18_008542 [Coniosporium uncinatum]|uniref:Uncharacterized protein n=1 Tax=Coniosporium uncinatum TaxID=93489 RepID=A0ACC3DN88_9PEZI|nr:hypothetical protein LTS18_008542 [Coniosporium uncinatum]
MRCTTCGSYIGKGKRFNARKQTAEETYLGIKIYRFYIKCPECKAEVAFRTDPESAGYLCEKGAERVGRVEGSRKVGVEEEEIGEQNEDDRMAEVETRRDDAVVNLREADALDEIRLRNARHERGFRLQSKGTLSQKLSSEDERRAREDVEDAELTKRAFAKRKVVDVEDLMEHDANTNVGS